MIRDIGKIITSADIVLVLILLIISAFMFAAIKDDISAKQVEISIHNKLVTSVPLNKDRIINLDDGLVIEIIDSKVRIKESTCKNHYCVKQGWSSSFPIICVPNEVSVVIKSKNKAEMLITK